MENIARIFRGDPEKFEITRAMGYLLWFFVLMLSFVPIALYIIFQDISDRVLNAVFGILIVDIVCMFCVHVFVILVWCPYFYPDRSILNRRHSDPAQKCQTYKPTSAACSVEKNAFQDISIHELCRRVNQPFDANGNECEGSLNTESGHTIDVYSLDRLPNLDQKGTYNGHALLHMSNTCRDKGKRHHHRFWTEPQTCTREASNVDAEKESASEERATQRIEKKPKTPPPRSFKRLKLKLNRSDSLASFRRPRGAFVDCKGTTDALGLVSGGKPKPSSTEDWVMDEKNAPQDFDSKVRFARKRSRSNSAVPAASSREETSNSNKWTIPASADDTRHRVLHRLLATILTTGDDDTLDPSLSGRRQELEAIDVPRMELEQLPSGDCVVQIRMRLSRKELQNFTSRRATNLEYLVKGSALENYVATLC